MKREFERWLSGRNTRLLVCSLVYQAVWFAAVYSASRPPLLLMAPAILVVGLTLQLALWRVLIKQAIVMMLAGLLAGVFIDGALILAGVLVPLRQLLPYPVPPIWLLTLWAGFGIYMATGLELMYGRPRVALIAGGLGGPLAYRAGVPFGALELGANAWASLAVIGLVWAIAFPLLITLAGRLANGGRTGGEPRAQSGAAGKQRPAKPNLPNTRILAVFLLASTLGASSAALALDGDASLFVPVRTLHDVKLARRGVGRLRRWMIKGCDIALYTPPATPRNELLTGGPKALEFYYYVGIKGEQFARASEETLKGELSGETYARFKAQIDEMGSYFTAVEPGDRYLLYFVPGHGTALDLNGKRRGVIPGDAFADIYFRIWLGEKPLDKALYKGMTRGMK